MGLLWLLLWIAAMDWACSPGTNPSPGTKVSWERRLAHTV